MVELTLLSGEKVFEIHDTHQLQKSHRDLGSLAHFLQRAVCLFSAIVHWHQQGNVTCRGSNYISEVILQQIGTPLLWDRLTIYENYPRLFHPAVLTNHVWKLLKFKHAELKGVHAFNLTALSLQIVRKPFGFCTSQLFADC